MLTRDQRSENNASEREFSENSCTPDDQELLTEDDLSLIHALQIAPRAGWSQLAPVLGAHPNTIAERWERIRSRGLAWITAHELGTSQTSCLGLIEVDYELAERDTVIETLSRIPEVVSFDLSTRSRDLLLLAGAPSVGEFSRDVLDRLAGIRGITHYQTSFCTRVYRTGEQWRLSSLSSEQQRRVGRLNPSSNADETGSFEPSPQLLDILAHNGRATAADIARLTGVHATTAQRQLNKARRMPSLLWRCDVSQAAAGYPITCHWFARLAADLHGRAATELAKLPGVRLCTSTTGATNFLVTMWLSGMEEVARMEEQLLELIPSMQLVESAVTMQIIKRSGWMLTPDGRATGEVVRPVSR
ncbi:Lrp/AsnC ligand binding domain-containing protein [uncultured Agrococcus sp.]|uniref:Lrp/AsnC family transcriptional regulator n=1 Tax=uncultured Agrococcus sp. TaxID=382258 RepID=UPI0025F1C9C4|nr:Lrp/AsnC ligand binding domain-containing protein [uncultured Agrococcus sp.]